MQKKQSKTDQPTDRRTDRPTDTVTYRLRARDKKRVVTPIQVEVDSADLT